MSRISSPQQGTERTRSQILRWLRSALDPTRTYYGGFTLTVIYELDSLPVSRVALFAGSQWVTSASTADFSFYADKTAHVSVGWTAWDGDRGTSGDQASLDSDNFQPYGWSGAALLKNDAANAADSTAFGSKYANTLGVDAKSFVTKDKVKSGLHQHSRLDGGRQLPDRFAHRHADLRRLTAPSARAPISRADATATWVPSAAAFS